MCILKFFEELSINNNGTLVFSFDSVIQIVIGVDVFDTPDKLRHLKYLSIKMILYIREIIALKWYQ